MSLGEKLRLLRKENGYSLDQVRLIMSNMGQSYCKSSIYKWEHGEVEPDLKTLNLLCKIYKTNMMYLTEEKSSFEEMQNETENYIITKIREDAKFKDMCLSLLRIKKGTDKIKKSKAIFMKKAVNNL